MLLSWLIVLIFFIESILLVIWNFFKWPNSWANTPNKALYEGAYFNKPVVINNFLFSLIKYIVNCLHYHAISEYVSSSKN